MSLTPRTMDYVADTNLENMHAIIIMYSFVQIADSTKGTLFNIHFYVIIQSINYQRKNIRLI